MAMITPNQNEGGRANELNISHSSIKRVPKPNKRQNEQKQKDLVRLIVNQSPEKRCSIFTE